MKYILYGANGYTAQLMIQESIQQGLKPVLAGRTKSKIEAVAKKFGLEYLVFDLTKSKELVEILRPFDLCLNAAGPFSKTAEPMIEACISSKTHYLDITGEIAVFELAKSYDKQAKEAGVMVMPGVGFDVVPSDCLANYLKGRLPDANNLELAFTSIGGALSHGTATTMVENLGEQSAARVNREIKKVRVGHLSKKIDFGEVKHWTMTIPWGDVSTAYTSTNIPNIVVYTGVPKSTIKFMKYQNLFNPIMRTNFVKNMAQKYIDKNINGPNAAQNEKGKSLLWGEVKNEKGEVKTSRLVCKEGYLLTALASILITKKVLNKDLAIGYQTPAKAYGHDLILEIEGSEFTDV